MQFYKQKNPQAQPKLKLYELSKDQQPNNDNFKSSKNDIFIKQSIK